MPSGPLSNEQVPGRSRGTLADEALRQDLTQTKGIVNSLQTTVAGLSQKLRRVLGVNGAEPWLGNPSSTGDILSSTINGKRSWISPPSGGGVTAGYIDGIIPTYASTTTITLGTGSYWHPGSSTLVTVGSPVTITPTLAASTLYYLYGDAAGAFVASSTAPGTKYFGTAWENGTNDRYVGAFLTDASSHIIKFLRSGNRIAFLADTTSAPFALVSSGSTTVASHSCTGVVPVTCCMIDVVVDMTSAGSAAVSVGFGTSTGYTPTLTTGAPFVQGQTIFGGPQTFGAFVLNLDASQAFTYIGNGAPAGMLIQMLAWIDER